MTTAEARALRNLLLDRRAQALGAISALERNFQQIVDASAEVATDDEHDPEGATIAFERAQVDALRARAREQVAELDTALERLDAGTFGRCAECGEQITPERLAARPSAATCITCASSAARR